MKEIDFTHGRLAFSKDTYEMLPCLPEMVDPRIQLFYMDPNGLLESGFREFAELETLRDQTNILWIHVSGVPSQEFWKQLGKFTDVGDEQMKYLRSPHTRSFFEDFENGLFWTLQRPSITENVDALETVNFLMVDKVLVTRQFSHENAFSLVVHKVMSKGHQFSTSRVDCFSGSREAAISIFNDELAQFD